MEFRRVIRALLVSAALGAAFTTTAMADGPGGGSGGAGSGGSGGPGGGGAHGHDGSRDGRPPGRPPGDNGPLPLEQDEALHAVQSAAALPLDRIVAAARHLTDGRIVDARLTNAGGALLYRLTVLEASGEVRAFYFYAVTAQLARVE